MSLEFLSVLFLFSLTTFINCLLSRSDRILGLPERDAVVVKPCLELRILTRDPGTRPEPTRNIGSGQTV